MIARHVLPAAGALWLANVAVAQSSWGVIQNDQPFPRLELPTLEAGKLVSAQALLQGKQTVLIIFGSW